MIDISNDQLTRLSEGDYLLVIEAYRARHSDAVLDQWWQRWVRDERCPDDFPTYFATIEKLCERHGRSIVDECWDRWVHDDQFCDDFLAYVHWLVN